MMKISPEDAMLTKKFLSVKEV